MSCFLISTSWSIIFQGSEGAVVIAGWYGLDCFELVSMFVSGAASDVRHEL